MYEQEKQKSIHLLILVCCTIFVLVLSAEAILLGWESSAIVLLYAGIIVSWTIHITGKIPESVCLWIYLGLSMLAFFFYGIHETSIFDMAPVMLMVILIYSTAERYCVISICVMVYFLTMWYDFFFVLDRSVELTPLFVSRILLHFALVYTAGRLSKVVVEKRRQEREVTERKIEELKETNRRTEDFLANVSHELRTPINAVTGISTVMLRKEEDADKRKEIRSVQEAGNRLFNQIEDILDYTEIDTGKIRVSEEPYMISSLVNDIITGNRLLMREDGPELIFDMDAKIPSVLIGDAKKIKKILKHLIDNAIKYTKKGGIYIRIYTMDKPYGVNLCIRVCDTGIGIEKEDLAKITDKFYKTEGGKSRRAGGLGLGLSIVHGMVAAMEGFMQMESTVDRGTMVSISIPQKISDETPVMMIEDRLDLCIGCFLRAEKFEVPRVREYYNEMISHLSSGLDIPLHRVPGMDELEKLTAAQPLTHLVIGKEEYRENPSYFEKIEEKKIEVILVAGDDFALPAGSKIRVFRKPFYSYALVSFLNAGRNGRQDGFQKKHMVCRNVKTLVVDDEPMNLLVAKEIFRGYEMEVETAGGGPEAIEACGKQDFELIFLDHMMPGMDGVETLKKLRKMQADTGRIFTIVAFTANAVSGAREMFLREGFDEFISKPIENSELEHVLKKVLPKASIRYIEDCGKTDETGHENPQDENLPYAEEKCIRENPEEDRMSALQKAGIHTDSGLRYCRDDAEFYMELLGQFARNSAKKQEEIELFFAQRDFDNYRIAVHALKSTAKMLGADALSEMALQAEAAVKNHDEKFIAEHHEELMDEYRNAVQAISHVIDGEDDRKSLPAGKDREEIAQADLIRQLEALKENLPSCEMNRVKPMLLDMGQKRYHGVDMTELLDATLQDVEDFEFEEAGREVDALLKRVRGGEL